MNLKHLLKYLPHNYQIILKLHPNQTHLTTTYNQIHNPIHSYFNQLLHIQQLYILTQSIITHYSSTIFHYIHLNNPLFILQQHHQQYKQTLPFYFHFFQLRHFLKPSLNQHILPKQISSTHYINYSKLLHPFIKQHTSKTT
ncbi:CDP-glycerol glycerophosphotransferase family protein, partial [Staphylococcus epidermidis]|uniref:CDP-glycerol glycerophosphotransferase family protein n=1 Tax=Staphylococcus epidermidis TaxID=1282 RepID=UPI0021B2E007